MRVVEEAWTASSSIPSGIPAIVPEGLLHLGIGHADQAALGASEVWNGVRSRRRCKLWCEVTLYLDEAEM